MLRENGKKRIALFFLVVLNVQLFSPLLSYAITSGPSQPEMKSFEPASATDLVDLFTGDLKYNIPLLDVGGYPVNLSYHSGTGMEEDASWVGTGWTLNPGAMNRTLRGLPDEFDGSNGDLIKKEYYRKEFQKVSGTVILKPSAFGFEYGRASVKLNVYRDNYYGIGASVGAGLSFNLAKNSQTPLTAGLNIGSDTRSGVSITPSMSIKMAYDEQAEQGTIGLSGNFTYNTRQGLKNYSLGASFSPEYFAKVENSLSRSGVDAVSPYGPSATFVHEFGYTPPPFVSSNTTNSSKSFSFDGGVTIFGQYIGIGGSGSFYKEKISEPVSSSPAFGYINYLKGYKDENAILDYTREKDGVFVPGTPSIAIPVATHDYFTAVNQVGSRQYRPYFAGNYIVFDKAQTNNSSQLGLGLTVGGGNLIKGGARIDLTATRTQTKKWTAQNNYLIKGEYTKSNAADEEPVYFKQVGEHAQSDADFFNLLKDSKTLQVAINDKQNSSASAVASLAFKSRENGREAITDDLKKNSREIRNNTFSILTAEQAKKYGLNKTINSYAPNQIIAEERDGTPAVNPYRQKHHISEIQVTDNEGKRMVYGIPVYNIEQKEVSFSITHPTDDALKIAKQTGLVSYNSTDASKDNKNGRDNLFSRQTLPPYPTSFLLTAILSPDYVDKTNNGISDDDLGTAIKFNYEKVPQGYEWRAPFEASKANFNEGLLSDPKDDKANYVYGKKEIWYLKSIESSTMIAFFDLTDREDGLGVSGENGGINTSVKLKKLSRIRLYLKADYNKAGNTPTPIKVVNFEYDYSLYPNVPNNTGTGIDKDGNLVPAKDMDNVDVNVNVAKGKLTLKKVWFTFGNSTRGKSNPYEFQYDSRPISSIPNLPAIPSNDLEFSDVYTQRQSDRWGTYKKSFYNEVLNGVRVLNNSEFPYTLQENENTSYSEKDLVNLYSSKWQLNKITTPTGSIITVDYESDDYSYVQDKKAMQMCFLKGINTINSDAGLPLANKLVIELPLNVSTPTQFKDYYLRQADGSYLDKIFYKVYVNMDNRGHWEYVNGYAEIDINDITVAVDRKTVTIGVKRLDGYNPIAKAAWQMLKLDLPQYAYDYYDNSDIGDGEAAVRSIIQALGNLGELGISFEQRAIANFFAYKVDLTKSMVRLLCPSSGKLGGGSRVSKVLISDEWKEMVAGGNVSAKYGQIYDYTTTDKNGRKWSTGVASYEPQAGNEENPFHEPINFTEKVHWSSDRYHFIEKPFCESYFPAPEVGYSMVTVTSIGDDYVGGTKPKGEAGYIENEFYTARDFPTLVDYMPLDFKDASNSLTLALFASVSIRNAAASQGFKVEQNDMHGKQKAVRIYDKGGDLISSSEYFYSVKDDNAPAKELNNSVDILKRDGTIAPDRIIATDIDFTTDVRESTNISLGTSVGAYVGSAMFMIPLPYGGINFNSQVMSDSYHSVSAVKVIRRYGILKKIVNTQNGSTISSENLLWDGQTGEVLLTRTQNEFDNYTYAFNYPAYMAYDGMGAAYKNIGVIIDNLATGADGMISYSWYPYLVPGDVVGAVNQDKLGWVIRSSDGTFRLIDAKGNFISTTGKYLILRSGRRNLLSSTVGTVICEKDPRENGAINLAFSKSILDAKSLTYNEQWSLPVADFLPTDVFEPSCTSSINYPINPYYNDILGNWKPRASYVYTVSRVQVPGNPQQNGGTDIRSSGYYNSFTPFWTFGVSGLSNNIPAGGDIPSNDNRWVWSNKSIHFDEKGNELESVDALNRYSSALFGYKQSLAIAVGANARHNEIGFDGFEDYGYRQSPTSSICLPNSQLNFRLRDQNGEWNNNAGKIVSSTAHTGKYSYQLNPDANLTISSYSSGNPAPATNILAYDNSGRYILKSNELNDGFAPVSGKKYLLSFWVNDHEYTSNKVQGLTVKINGGAAYDFNSQPTILVEGWKKVDISFDMGTSPFYLQLITGSTRIEIDDIRIVPYDGNINTYVYDDMTLRLMAQLDENNFATLYEYDDEGTPVRVKKETEKGILTLKENRKAFRARP